MPQKQPSARGSITFTITVWIIALVALGGAVYGTYLWQRQDVDRLNQEVGQLHAELLTAQNQTPANIYTSQKGVKITLYTPARNSQVASPLIILGAVPGNWSFEASFPIKLIDANGRVVAQAPAQLLSDWMTDQPVAFSAKLTYSSQPSGSGTLVLQKDNPSGLPTKDDSLSVPIKF